MDSASDKEVLFLANTVTHQNKAYAGQHMLVDFWGCVDLCDSGKIESAMLAAAKAANTTVLNSHVHEFPGGGVTGVVMLAESHISIHTWPEYDYAAIDVFLCGDSKIQNAIDCLVSQLKPNKHEVQTVYRGRIE